MEASKSQWVKVSDDTPDYYQDVLVYMPEIGMRVCYIDEEGQWFYANGRKAHIHRHYYWRQLPDPPKSYKS